MSATDRPFVLQAVGIEKRFGVTTVLDGASLRVRPGEIHALLGGNGAGKSTLIKIVSGVLPADNGRVLVDGSATPDPGAIAVVFQELALLPHLSVAENISLPLRRRGMRLYRAAAERDAASAALGILDAGLAPDLLERPVGTLDLHQRQLVEIARALQSGARLLLLDEPTANLTFIESERLFAVLRRLAAAQRIGVLLVSHRMDEIRAVAEVCTVIRNGRTVLERRELASISDAAIVEAMGQRSAGGAGVAPARVPAAGGGSLLSLTHGGMRIDVERGAVLGLAGAPDGPTELINALIGAAASRAWSARFENRPLSPATPADAIRRGVGYVSGDRAEKGILATLPILDNLVAGTRVATRRVFTGADELRHADRSLRHLAIKTSSVDALPQALSGGTQQKLLLARWLDPAPRILVLEEPTRGVDVGTKRDIYDIIRAAGAAGTIVLWWSTEFAELVEVCDRVVAFDLAGEPVEVIERDALTNVTLARATGMAA